MYNKLKNIIKSNKGFTLIELLVVIAIIAILVTIIVVAINPGRLVRDAQDTKRRADINQIKAGMQLYYNDNKSYPLDATFDPLFGGTWAAGGTTYMRQVPNDPAGAYAYTGVTCATSCTGYTITADLNSTTTATGTGTRSTEDVNTLNKCGIALTSTTVDFAVCND